MTGPQGSGSLRSRLGNLRDPIKAQNSINVEHFELIDDLNNCKASFYQVRKYKWLVVLDLNLNCHFTL